jgi:hypothetical protein
MDLVWPQDHVGKASKPSRQVAAVSTESCVIVVGLIFILGTLDQDRARPQGDGKHLRDAQGRSPPWPPP